MNDVELDVRASAEEALEGATALVAGAVDAGGHVALSGGSSPKPVYERVAVLRPDWSGVELWWVDDRCVPRDDERSNYRLIAEALLDRLVRLPREVHRMQGESPPEEGAAAYDAALQGVELDFALMGIGPDGHTASLFPNAPQLDEQERNAVAAEAGLEPFVPRITMTRPLLASTGTMVYLATGEGKADAVRRAFAGAPDRATPASLVRGRRTIAVLDAAAAALL